MIELASSATVPAPQTEGEASLAPVARPRCSRCRASLSESARYTSIEAAPGDNDVEGQGPLSVTVFYCGRCGTTLGAPVEIGPELNRPLTSTVHNRPPPGRIAKPARRFPDELLASVRLEDVLEESRVVLSYRDDEVLEGAVAGTEVRLTGRLGSPRGSFERYLGSCRRWGSTGASATTPAAPGELPCRVFMTGQFR